MCGRLRVDFQLFTIAADTKWAYDLLHDDGNRDTVSNAI